MSDPVDPREKFEEECKPKCINYLKEYEACVERVQQKGEGHCTGQSFDYLHCLDKCVAPKIFKAIK
eukprot:CAMPEP_0184508498 /NCGR_PEP_ID=MMETSP0198_2-20121128/793_1 /TAXON_ID=1112570 /ORGANISM="Thraustochytrium sp., Strain LLF1b" /LENGTH=65 /DNA_ID=CAMNT_0026898287 /DNA_START=170 /DNA_END=367 /DNA_ORIENTATION=-